MTVAFWKASKNIRIKGQRGIRIYNIQSILFINRLTAHHSPTSLTLFKKIIKPAGTHYIHQNIMYRSTLINRHLGLGDSSVSCHITGKATMEMDNTDPFFKALSSRSDKVL